MIKRRSRLFMRIASTSLAIFVMLIGLLDVWPLTSVQATQLSSRSLTVSSSANGTITTDISGVVQAAGSGGNGAQTAETFGFTLNTTGNVGAIAFIYCTTPIYFTSCTTPTGLTTANVTAVSSQSGFSTNNFSLDTSTTNQAFDTAAGLGTAGSGFGCNGTGGSATRQNCLLIKRASAANETAPEAVTVKFGGTSGNYITNPTASNTTWFVRIMTFSDTAYTTLVDYGTVASSTATQVGVTSKVQESLSFSVGTTVTAPNGNTCTPFSDTGALNLGGTVGSTPGILSTTQAYDAHSYFRIGTNATHGTVVQYSGNTLTSGGNTIAAMGTTQPTPNTAASSSPGSAQYGIGIDSSDTQGGSGYSFTSLSATAPYNSANGTITNGGTALFAFAPSSQTVPVAIASSTGIIACDTGSVRYLGNIAPTTPAGIYTSTVTFIAVPTF